MAPRNPSQPVEPAYRRGPAPKRLRGGCPAPFTLECEGDRCRFIKKGCVYSRMKENNKVTSACLQALIKEHRLEMCGYIREYRDEP